MTTNPDTQLLAQLQTRQQQLADYDLPWLRETRSRGLARFAQLGFPGGKGRRREHWKYTDMHIVADNRYWRTVAGSPDINSIKASLAAHTFSGQPLNRLVFINGHYAAPLSQMPDLDDHQTDDLVIEDFAGALMNKPALLSDRLHTLADDEKFPFAAINAGLLENGAVISVPDGVELNRPVHLLFLSAPSKNASGQYFSTNPRILIIGGCNSRFDVIEHYGTVSTARNGSTAESNRPLTNTVVEIFLENSAYCRYTKIQQETGAHINLGATYVRQNKNSQFESYSVCLGGGLIRNDLHIRLAGEHAQCNLQGLYLPKQHEHIDNHTCIEHLATHCRSREYYKGLIDDHGHAVFNGRIHIHPGAQKTDAALRNKNLLLSEQAEVDTKPELEIYADDVSCAHGATVGELDKEQIHYLESRGIHRSKAKSMLSLAFANEIIEALPYDELRCSVYDTLAKQVESTEPE